MTTKEIKKGLIREIDAGLDNQSYSLRSGCSKMQTPSDCVIVKIDNIVNVNDNTLDIRFDDGDIYTIKITKKQAPVL